MCEPRLDQIDEESTPLLSSASDPEDGNYDCDRLGDKCSKWSCFYVFCFLSGQYIDVDAKKTCFKTVVAWLGFLFFLFQFIFYLGHVGTAVAVEVCRIGNFNNYTTNCSLPNVYWKFSTAVTVGTLAAFLSYAFFTIIILVPVNGILTCCCKSENSCKSDSVFCNACSKDHRKAFKTGALSPFNDSNESSKLSTAETRCFFINYAIVWVLYVSSFGSSLWFAFAAYYNYDNHQPIYNLGSCWISKLNVAKIFLHFSTAFCAIHSCFIFSKIVNKVTNKLKTLARDMDRVDFAGENAIKQVGNDEKLNVLFRSNDKEKIDRARFYWLQEMDKKFIQQVKPTLNLLGVWFLVHWVMYALTTVLLTAFVLQNVLDIARNRIKSMMDHLMPISDIDLPYLFYLVFFTLVHAYLFLYCPYKIYK